jgi:ABC-2 type transport system permease protein
MTTATLRQLLHGKRFWWMLAFAGLPALIMALAGRGESDSAAYRIFHEGPFFTLVLLVIPVVAVVFGTAALGDERRNETLSVLVVRPLPRSSIVIAKILGAWLASVAVSGAGAVVATVILGIYSGSWEPLGAIVVLVALSSLGYVAIFVPLGHMVKLAAWFALAFVFLWDTTVAVAIEGLAPFSVSRIGLSAYVALVDSVPRDVDDLMGSVVEGAGGAAVKALVLAALAVWITTELLRRRDLV